MRTDDLIITIAYFSIPIQILVVSLSKMDGGARSRDTVLLDHKLTRLVFILLQSLYHYPRLHGMQWHIVLLIVLFALFVLMCGAGHLLKCMEMTETAAFRVVNGITAGISLVTAMYLLPIIPFLMSSLDHTIQDLVKLNEETEDSKRKLMTFMAFLCHEIRNPLFIITSTISFMEETASEGEEATSIGLVKQSTNLMLRLVNDVLDISRLESGKVELEKDDFNLYQTLEGANTSARVHIRDRHGKKPKDDGLCQDVVEFRSHIDPDVPKLVHGDQSRVLQVCLNLLSNAIKFTDRGFVDFRVSVCNHADALDRDLIMRNTDVAFDFAEGGSTSGDEREASESLLLQQAEAGTLNRSRDEHIHPESTVLKIRVEDTGCGIPIEQIDRIFRPYSMAKLAEYRQRGGTGLGLAIVSKLTAIMNGSVHVRSTVGIGTVFEAYIIVEHPSSSNFFGTESDDTTTLTDASTVPPFSPDTSLQREGSEHSDGHPRPLLNTVSANGMSKKECCTTTVIENGPSTRPAPTKRSWTQFDFRSGEAVVLVVDDNAMNRKLLTRMLKSFNLEYREACDGQEAVDAMLLSRNHTGDPGDPWIAFVLMDLSMPVLGGVEATKIIRQKGMNVPIMALTAAAIEQGREAVMAAGATDYATKPILREQLHRKCSRFISPLHS